MEKITYKKSLEAKLILGQESISSYQAIMDLCKTHKKVSTRMSFGKMTISYGKNKVAVVKIVVRHIQLYLALDPKDYGQTKYHFKDISDTKQGQVYPMRVCIKGARSLKYALELLEDALAKVGANELCATEDINYQEIFYPRGFDVLLEEGLIKKYVKTENKALEEEEEPMVEVKFVAKLLYEAHQKADKLYIITNTNLWDPSRAIPMKKQKNGSFTAIAKFPVDTHLEFKICREQDWLNVEKGIWKEEIINHYYHLEKDTTLEVEDLIYNFRED